MKFTDEQLSRILSAHSNGELRRHGMTAKNPTKVCVMQAAYQVTQLCDNGCCADFDHKRRSNDATEKHILWFDSTYNPGWPLGRFLRELEARGLA